MAGEWAKTTLGQFLESEGGSIVTGPFGTALKASEYTPTGVPVISVSEVGFGRIQLKSHTPRVDPSVTQRLPKYLLKQGDIVFARKGAGTAVERSALVSEQQDGWFLGSDGIRIRLPKKCSAPFISYWLQSQRHRSWMKQHAVGTTMPALNEGIVKRIPLCLPLLAEQKAIAAVLGALDDKIELNRRMNETLEAMARALFQNWFGDATQAGLPKGWRESTLGELIELAYGKALKAEDRQPGEIPVFGSNGQVGWHNEKLVQGPGIVVGRKGNPGIVTWSPTDFFPIDTTFYVVPKGECRSLYFLFYVLLAHDLASLGADSAVPGLNRNMAYLSQQVVPPPDVLKKFDGIVKPLFEKIHANDDESRTLAALRDTLLPKLLSGELRVPAAPLVEANA